MGNNKQFTEKDWKIFKSKLAGWQESYMDRLNQEYIQLLSDNTKLSSVKFWELHKRIQKDKYDFGVQIETCRSNLIPAMIELIKDGIIVENELKEFSDELIETIEIIKV